MALELNFFPGYKDGDEPLSVANQSSYVGGMPLGAFADGIGVTTAGANLLGMALSDKIQDAQNGKAGYAPRGSKGILRPSLSPSLDKLIIAKGISAGAANFGYSNNKAFARSMPVSTENPAYLEMDPTDLGVTKVYPYDEASGTAYTSGVPLYIKTASGQFTATVGDSDGVKVGLVVKKVGDDLTVIV